MAEAEGFEPSVLFRYNAFSARIANAIERIRSVNLLT